MRSRVDTDLRIVGGDEGVTITGILSSPEVEYVVEAITRAILEHAKTLCGEYRTLFLMEAAAALRAGLREVERMYMDDV